MDEQKQDDQIKAEPTADEADGYYGEDEMDDEEPDLSFLDEDDEEDGESESDKSK
jgi:hypothetical protein